MKRLIVALILTSQFANAAADPEKLIPMRPVTLDEAREIVRQALDILEESKANVGAENKKIEAENKRIQAENDKAQKAGRDEEDRLTQKIDEAKQRAITNRAKCKSDVVCLKEVHEDLSNLVKKLREKISEVRKSQPASKPLIPLIDPNSDREDLVGKSGKLTEVLAMTAMALIAGAIEEDLNNSKLAKSEGVILDNLFNLEYMATAEDATKFSGTRWNVAGKSLFGYGSLVYIRGKAFQIEAKLLMGHAKGYADFNAFLQAFKNPDVLSADAVFGFNREKIMKNLLGIANDMHGANNSYFSDLTKSIFFIVSSFDKVN